MKVILTILIFASSMPAWSQLASAFLDGSNSIRATYYHWRQISGVQGKLRTPNAVSCKVDSLTTGVKIFELTCSNSFGQSKDSVKIIITKPYGVTITNPVFKYPYLTWTVSNEINVSYFLIEKSIDGGQTFTSLPRYYSRGISTYTYRPYGSAASYIYQITPVFRNTLKGITFKFQ